VGELNGLTDELRRLRRATVKHAKTIASLLAVAPEPNAERISRIRRTLQNPGT
jgi:hypothetical protein